MGSNLETSVEVSSDDFSPFERVVITANGNLQRIMSAYYGAPVSVRIIRCNEISPRVFDREVELIVGEKVFCTAVGKVIYKTFFFYTSLQN